VFRIKSSVPTQKPLISIRNLFVFSINLVPLLETINIEVKNSNGPFRFIIAGRHGIYESSEI